MNHDSNFLYRNRFSIVIWVMAILSLYGHIYIGLQEQNEFLAEYGILPISLSTYLTSADLIKASFKNWESEFLPIALGLVRYSHNFTIG